MHKESLMAFLAGMVIPLILAGIFQKVPLPGDVERGELTATEAPKAVVDAATGLTVRNRAGNLQQMTMEDYLVGVVLAEMPASFEPEALKAQAVVARTYTRKRMAGGKHGEAAVCMDAGCCQAYTTAEEYLEKGGRSSAVEKIRSAVAATDGLVLTYEDKLIDATYFSCSGGSTEDAVAVWGQDVPYLQAVESPGEEDAPRFSDTVTFTAAEFAALLGLPNEGKPENWFGSLTRTDGGGVETMEIQGKTFRGTALRAKLGLRSTAFDIQVRGKTVEVSTRCFGHRVGMSQYGAQAMAEAGSSFAQILAHYYMGTELKNAE